MEKRMPELPASTFRTVGPADAIPNDSVAPYHLDDRKRRIAITRVDDHLYAFDDLCTCAHMSYPEGGTA
jgi:hypothetical protein